MAIQEIEKLSSYDVYRQRTLLRSLGVSLKSSRTENISENHENTIVEFCLMDNPIREFKFVLFGRDEFVEFLAYDRDEMIIHLKRWTCVGGKCYFNLPKTVKSKNNFS